VAPVACAHRLLVRRRSRRRRRAAMSAQGLPAHILALFTPRPPPQHLPPQVQKKKIRHTGLADFVEFFSSDVPPKRETWESPLERKERRHKEKLEKHKEALKALIAEYDPHKDPNAVGDPFKTLFVGRISFDSTEKKLKREFEVFGSIKKVRLVYDQKGKPRGYAFIEFEHERDLKNAYKQGDGKKIDGRRVMVDVERGRTVEGWLPRRLGGGRGPGRVGKPSKKKMKKLEAAESSKDKDKDRDRDRDRDRRGDREDRGKDREKDRDRKEDRGDRGDKDKGKEKAKDKEKEKPKEKPKDGEKEKPKDGDRKRDRERSRSRDRKKTRRD